MIKYLKTKWNLWRAERRLKLATEIADHTSKHYNKKQIILYKNAGLNIQYDNGNCLLRALDGNFLMMNRNGFLLARRRGMFTKNITWTMAVQSSIYSTI